MLRAGAGSTAGPCRTRDLFIPKANHDLKDHFCRVHASTHRDASLATPPRPDFGTIRYSGNRMNIGARELWKRSSAAGFLPRSRPAPSPSDGRHQAKFMEKRMPSARALKWENEISSQAPEENKS